MIDVCVIGLGYIGLPTAVSLASCGLKVHGVDVDSDKISSISTAVSPIDEDGLDELLQRVVSNSTLNVSKEIPSAPVYIICVPTPLITDNLAADLMPKPDLSAVYEASDRIVEVAPPGSLIVLESTSPVGTTEALASRATEQGRRHDDILFAYCPERVLPGDIMHELTSNDRIVGGTTDEATRKAAELYKKLTTGNIHETTARAAELCKLLENSYRDVNIAFANEVSFICDQLSLNADAVISLTNCHPRVDILSPGIGVGGHCIPVDPWFLVDSFPKNTKLIQTGRAVNTRKTDWVAQMILNRADKLQEMLGRPLKIGLFGLSYKPDVSDIRESPALTIVRRLGSGDHKLYLYDPHVNEISGHEMCDFNDVEDDLDLGVMLVNHDVFRQESHRLSNIENMLDFCGVTSA